MTILTQLKSGDYLDLTRIRRIGAVVLVVSFVSLAGLIATSRGGVDIQGRPLGPDFFAFWSAGVLASSESSAALNPDRSI